jgi:hypothetical protein
MKKVATFLAGAVSVVLVAMLLPANVFAFCPTTGVASFVQCGTGGEVVAPPGTPSLSMSGNFWIQGQANPAFGSGTDAGTLAGTVADGDWLGDLGIDGNRCLAFDWNNPAADGCPTGSAPLWVVISDSANNAFIASNGGILNGASVEFDFSNTVNGDPAPIFGGATSGLTLQRAVHVNTASTAGGLVTLNVAALAIPNYSETGARAIPGARLAGTNLGSPIAVTGAGGGPITVDKDSNLCWEIVDTGVNIPVGCVRVGGLTPSQNVQDAKVTLGKGKLNFSWDVSAQFDVLGFNIIQKSATKGTERTVNSTLIPINGMNDAQAASYNFSAGRNELQATRGGFEIEMVRTNGETSRTPAPLK